MLIRVAVFTGMRRGQVLGLRWRDVDHEAGLIRVRRRVCGGKVGPPKSTSGKHDVTRFSGSMLPPLGEQHDAMDLDVLALAALDAAAIPGRSLGLTAG